MYQVYAMHQKDNVMVRKLTTASEKLAVQTARRLRGEVRAYGTHNILWLWIKGSMHYIPALQAGFNKDLAKRILNA